MQKINHAENIKAMRKEWPSMTIIALQENGANLSTAFGIVTVYWKKQKYCIDGNWAIYSNIKDFIKTVKDWLNAKIIKMNNPKAVHIGSKAGVQDCIDHIYKKRDLINANSPNNQLSAFCLTLIEELKQYL